MTLETFQSLTVLLLFAAPGAVFIYGYSRAFSPGDRVDFVRQQFPIDLAVLYVTSSAIIHLVLMAIALLVFNIIVWRSGTALVPGQLLDPLLNLTTADVRSLTLSAILVMSYFVGSLILAYLAGRVWASKHVPAVQLWVRELIDLRVKSQRAKEPVMLEMQLLDGTCLDGEWKVLRLLNRKDDTFEISLLQPRKNQTIVVSSACLTGIDATLGQETKKILLAAPKNSQGISEEEDR